MVLVTVLCCNDFPVAVWAGTHREREREMGEYADKQEAQDQPGTQRRYWHSYEFEVR